jgi:hypothetical protein
VERPPNLDGTSESGMESGSGTDRECCAIEVNPAIVEVNMQKRLWLAFPDGTEIPNPATRIVVGFYSTTNQVRRSFVEGHMGHNYLLVTVDNPGKSIPCTCMHVHLALNSGLLSLDLHISKHAAVPSSCLST